MRIFSVAVSLIFSILAVWLLFENGYSHHMLLAALFFGICCLVVFFKKPIEKSIERKRTNNFNSKHCRIKSDHFEFPKGYYIKYTSLQNLYKLPFSEIEEFRPTYPPSAKINGKELIFLLGMSTEEIATISTEQNIPFSEEQDNWSLICEEFLDTEHSARDKKKTLEKLRSVGVFEDEVLSIRKKNSVRMLALTMLTWEWIYYGQFDVLDVINPMNEEDYWWTMEIALRNGS